MEFLTEMFFKFASKKFLLSHQEDLKKNFQFEMVKVFSVIFL